MPAKVSVNTRPMVTAGLAKRGGGGEPVGGADVGADRGGRERGAAGAGQGEDEHDQSGGGDDLAEPQVGRRAVLGGEICTAASPNITLASTAPAIAPRICATV